MAKKKTPVKKTFGLSLRLKMCVTSARCRMSPQEPGTGP